MKYINILSLLLLVTLIIIIANIYNFFLYKRININTIHNALHINANSLTEKNILDMTKLVEISKAINKNTNISPLFLFPSKKNIINSTISIIIHSSNEYINSNINSNGNIELLIHLITIIKKHNNINCYVVEHILNNNFDLLQFCSRRYITPYTKLIKSNYMISLYVSYEQMEIYIKHTFYINYKLYIDSINNILELDVNNIIKRKLADEIIFLYSR